MVYSYFQASVDGPLGRIASRYDGSCRSCGHAASADDVSRAILGLWSACGQNRRCFGGAGEMSSPAIHYVHSEKMRAPSGQGLIVLNTDIDISSADTFIDGYVH
jgi:hypothetical protein